MVGYIATAPKLYQIYLLYSLANSLAKWLIPGIHAQLVTGTWLGLLKSVNTGAYTDNVATRLRLLLVQQAKLRSPGRNAPQLSQEALDTLSGRLKEDPVLAEALGSVSALRIWHKLEKLPLDSPKLLDVAPLDSQERWIIEALKAGYYSDVEELVNKSAVTAAVKEASDKMKALREAVDSAAFSAAQGVQVAGAGGALSQVEKTSAEAAAALQALAKARESAQVVASDPLAWRNKLGELQATHASEPAVASELKRLSGGQ